ncbi:MULTISPECIES: LysR family transcriptional regulator [unclassified Cupriavidus]|uniref:LysR family transcriptional regulator n=1 Tax=unclassified Cupriavidus TaxID=2640874 RepID=UPI000291B7FB|nr:MULTISPECIES: LysR family transcriptional regulator [unclassified Cupriavidus]ESJ19938.1 LysR family transcriptional regulator [Cupriavidus sp. HPC(L)]MCD9120823.1 LysR family transcriptional regulator [Cupriavidus sp. UGS-1]
MNITPRQLRIFLALAQSLNFSRTAEQFFVTQPSLSKAVKEMEEELGIALFERSTRSVRLTPAGEQLVPMARRIVGEFDSGLRHLQSRAEQEAQRLSIAALPSLANVLLPGVCAALERRYPHAQIAVHDCADQAAVQRVIDYQVDFALASASPSNPDLLFREILRDRFVLLAPAQWRKPLRKRMHMDELAGLPLISMTDRSTAMKYMSAAFLQRGVQFRPKLQLDQIGTIAGFVKEGLGIAVLPYLGIMPLLSLKGMRVAEIVDGPVRSVGLVSRKTSPPSEIAAQAMVEVGIVADRLKRRWPGWIWPPAA